MLSNRSDFLKKVRNFWGRYRWVILAVTVSFSALIELYENLIHPNFLADPQHLFEMVLQGIILPLLLLTLHRSELQKNLAIDSLSALEHYIVQLNNAQGWNELFEVIVQIHQRILPLEGLALWLYDPSTERFTTGGVRVVEPGSHLTADQLGPAAGAHVCQAKTKEQLGVCLCRCAPLSDMLPYNRWCLPLAAGSDFAGLLHLYTRSPFHLSPEPSSLLQNIAPEIASALNKATLQRKIKLREEEVEAERRRLTKDLHDTLGQDVAFLCHKLNVLLESGRLPRAIKDDLLQMDQVAQEANQMIRNILSGAHGPLSAALPTRLLAYAQVIGERTGLKISFTSTGNPSELPDQAKFQVFLMFREALANIEKHASASRVNIALDWSEVALKISIHDDGRGFVTGPPRPNHFGLTIIQARAEALGGHTRIASTPDFGTQVDIELPIVPASLAEAAV